MLLFFFLNSFNYIIRQCWWYLSCTTKFEINKMLKYGRVVLFVEYPIFMCLLTFARRSFSQFFMWVCTVSVSKQRGTHYRVSFNSLRTLWAFLTMKNLGKCLSKSHRFKEEGCDFHSQLLFFSYVEANVFYSPWHLKLLKHEISSWSYICPSVKKINIHPTVSLF